MYYPSREEFKLKAKEGTLIPVYREVQADMETPVSAFMKLNGSPYAFLLESVKGGNRIGRYSFLGTDPLLVFKVEKNLVTIQENGETQKIQLKDGENPLAILKSLMNRHKFVPDDTLPMFSGGAVGYMGYDSIRYFEKLPEVLPDDLQVPDCFFMITDTILIFDHVRNRLKIVAHAPVNGNPDIAYDRAISKVDEIFRRLESQAVRYSKTPVNSTQPVEFTSNVTKKEFEKSIETAKEHIACGDIIQVVLSQRLSCDVKADPFTVYRALRSINPSPYMVYLSCDDLKLVGSSPEILVTLENSVITSRPIAGTRPRGKDSKQDRVFEKELMADPKERAEHVMLVDLARNDVGRVSKPGTVKVDELMRVERYSHVMHIVSNVKGEIDSGKDQFDALKACFPAGTVSGAPKIRAMQIIDQIEKTRRGPYAGSIGYFGFNGNMDYCITLRTMIIKDGKAYVQAGAGIVADSVPENEYYETLNKARALLRAIEIAEGGLD